MCEKNPWETGQEHDGIRPAYCSSEDRAARLLTMTAAQLVAALKWPDTQMRVRVKIGMRLRKMRKAGVLESIYFEYVG